MFQKSRWSVFEPRQCSQPKCKQYFVDPFNKLHIKNTGKCSACQTQPGEKVICPRCKDECETRTQVETVEDLGMCLMCDKLSLILVEA